MEAEKWCKIERETCLNVTIAGAITMQTNVTQKRKRKKTKNKKKMCTSTSPHPKQPALITTKPMLIMTMESGDPSPLTVSCFTKLDR
eukprot:11955294-Ditylum_brightwellii.AAC.1